MVYEYLYLVVFFVDGVCCYVGGCGWFVGRCVCVVVGCYVVLFVVDVG